MRQPPLAPARPPLRRLALSAALALLGAEAAAQAQPALNLPPVELRGAPLVEDLGLNGQAGPLRLAFDLQAQSSMRALNRARVVGVAITEQVGGFAVAHGRLALPLPALGRHGEVFLAVDNLFDRAYAYRPGYPMAGRSGLLGVAASF